MTMSVDFFEKLFFSSGDSRARFFIFAVGYPAPRAGVLLDIYPVPALDENAHGLRRKSYPVFLNFPLFRDTYDHVSDYRIAFE